MTTFSSGSPADPSPPSTPDPAQPGPAPVGATANTAPGAAATTPGSEPMRVTLPSQATPQERWLWRGLLAVLVLLAYVPSFSTEFIWDDNRHAGMTSLRDFDGLLAIWTRLGLEAGGTPQYYPLTHTTFWLEYQLFGRSPLAYRIVNCLIHAGAAVMLWELLRRLRVPGAYLAAAIFALHPLMVESVAWTSERKNTLSLLLALTSLWFFARYAGLRAADEVDGGSAREQGGESGDGQALAWAYVAFVGAMLAKTMAVFVPVAMLLMLWWQRRLTARRVLPVVPMFAVALGLGLLTAYTEHRYVIRPGEENTARSFTHWLEQKVTGRLDSGDEFDVPMVKRLQLAGVVPWFYLSKLVFPKDLMFFYPRWEVTAWGAFPWLGLAGVLAVTAVGVYLAWGGGASGGRGVRWPLAVWLGYLAALFPAMGFFDVYPFRYSYVADHFSYHAAWMLIAAAAAGLTWAWQRLAGPTQSPQLTLAASAVLCVAVGARTYVHAGHFIDNYALFSHTLAKNPTSWAAAHNLALEYVKMTEKARQVERQLAARLQQARRDNAAGLVAELERELAAANEEAAGFLREARRLLLRTLELRPQHEWAYHSLGTVAFLEGKNDEALEFFRESVRRRQDPSIARDGGFPGTHMLIGDLLVSKGDFAGALAEYRAAIDLENPPLKPRHTGVRISLLRTAIRLLNQEQRRPTEAEAEEFQLRVRELSELAPRNETAWLVIGDMMQKLGKPLDAVAAYRNAISINPGSVAGYLGMGYMLGLLGDLEGSRVALEEVLRLDPNNATARTFLAQLAEAATRPATTPSDRPAPATQPAGGPGAPPAP
ncbi:MAG: tetratricopeptide repeat protein [Tepidisphaerales bacterium]